MIQKHTLPGTRCQKSPELNPGDITFALFIFSFPQRHSCNNCRTNPCTHKSSYWCSITGLCPVCCFTGQFSSGFLLLATFTLELCCPLSTLPQQKVKGNILLSGHFHFQLPNHHTCLWCPHPVFCSLHYFFLSPLLITQLVIKPSGEIIIRLPCAAPHKTNVGINDWSPA